MIEGISRENLIAKLMDDGIKQVEPGCEIRNYSKDPKWLTVGYFEKEPRDWPSRSTEFKELAKFRTLGDAFFYAYIIARSPSSETWWAVAIR